MRCMNNSFIEDRWNDRIDSIDLDATDLRLLDLLQTRRLAVQPGAGRAPPTPRRRPACGASSACVDAGVIERRVAHRCRRTRSAPGLTAIVEVTLDRQGAEHLDAFEARAVAEAAVQQCYRVSPGPDFVLVVQVRRHAGLPRAGAAPVHAGRERAQRQEPSSASRAPSSSRACRCRRRRAAQAPRHCLSDDQALQVLAFGEGQRRRVVRRGAEPLRRSGRRRRHRCRRRRRSCGTGRRRCRPSTRT